MTTTYLQTLTTIVYHNLSPIDREIFARSTCLPNCDVLFCRNAGLSHLPELPNCTFLDCTANQLQTLPPLPRCHALECSNNQLTTLPALPQCTVLSCHSNHLVSLPALPKCQMLDCHGNLLQALPLLLKAYRVWCHDNHLTSLLPLEDEAGTRVPWPCASWGDLNCAYNRLSSLPIMTNCIYLICTRNPLLTLPPDLVNLLQLRCGKTTLESLPHDLSTECQIEGLHHCPLVYYTLSQSKRFGLSFPSPGQRNHFGKIWRRILRRLAMNRMALHASMGTGGTGGTGGAGGLGLHLQRRILSWIQI
jgi:hypothetical protein